MRTFWSSGNVLDNKNKCLPLAYQPESNVEPVYEIRKMKEFMKGYSDSDKSNWDLYFTHFEEAWNPLIQSSKYYAPL